MARPDGEISDGLEIISIGALYDGPWDKKYWSSSRIVKLVYEQGKDRYPHPVGYQATRTHNGITYKMAILEGLKGPLFTINSTTGHSCSGQTPDIAWESFQKKGCPRVKVWRGKRFSGKMDGVEVAPSALNLVTELSVKLGLDFCCLPIEQVDERMFFGFKNPYVQRLLRELVANVNGTAESSLLSTRICDGVSGTKHNTECVESCTSPDLPPCLPKPVVAVKSRKHKISNVKSVSEATVKRLRPQNQKQKSDASSSIQRIQRDHNDGSFSTSSASEEGYNPVLSAPVKLVTAVEEKNNSSMAEAGFCLDSSGSSEHLREEGLLPHEERKLVGPKDFIATVEADNLNKGHANRNILNFSQLVRSKVIEAEEGISSKTVEKEGEASVQNDQGINDMDLCAPDTVDLLLANIVLNIPKESSSDVKEELTAVHKVVSEDLVTDSHPEEEMITSTANGSSEKSEHDSISLEIANSMMTFLLPRALPLLKTFSRKKRTISKLSESPLCKMRSHEKSNGTEQAVDVVYPAGVPIENFQGETQKGEVHILSTDLDSRVSCFGDLTSVAPDSFENDQCENPVTDQLQLFQHVAEGDQTTIGQDKTASENVGPPASIGAYQGSAVCHMETNERKKSSCCEASKEEVHILSTELGSSFSNRGDITSVAPDSFENDQFENPASDQVPLFQYIAVGDQTTVGQDTTRDPKLMGMEPVLKEISLKTGGVDIENPIGQCNTPFSESIICRNFTDVCTPEICNGTKTLIASDCCQVSSGSSPIKRKPFGDNARLDPPAHNFHMKSCVDSEGTLCNMAPVVLQTKEFVLTSNCNDSSDFSDPFISSKTKSQSTGNKTLVGKDLVEFDDSNMKTETNIKYNNGLDSLQLVGCYLHPLPISLVLLSTKGNETYICVLSGLFMENRTLFIYKSPIEGKRRGSPSFIGHASIVLPVSRDAFSREIQLDSSSLQLTPDGRHLVLLNCIKAPYCSEGKIHCPCSACTSDCFEKNAVKIVQVKLGYVSVIVKLETADSVRCILVCEPNYLLGADEGGRLHLWLMNSTWSANTGECDLPTSGFLTPYIVELKRIPKYTALVVGHNGFGEFILWDISKRILVSRFSAPSVSVSQLLPVSLFRWKNAGNVPADCGTEEHINIIDQIKMCSKGGENHDFVPLDGEDVAIWLLISTVSGPDVQNDYQSSGCQNNPVECWRLALLVKNMVILGNALDPRAVAIGTSADYGIIGTCDGFVYMWELSTGMKLRDLDSFKGGGVTCIATDESSSGAVVAVAGDGGQLKLYYDHSRARDVANQQRK
ncbi:hypothetical protein LguiB_016023 [Lonicera macranthoides]